MKESIKTVFQCDFCDKRLFRRNAMINHELYCSRNQSNRDACASCTFCKEIEKTIYYDTWSGENTRQVKSFECTKLNLKMYPHKAQKIEANYPESFEDEVIMPNECEHFEYSW